jgi:HK97 family phage major capsid protein/HK97 family phage prohead protease
MTVIHKTTVALAAGDPLTFVLSDATKDRMGDVIDPKGWVLENFKQNPMALFNHNSSFPIGTWEEVKVQGGRLIGKLKLAARGTSDRIDEIISLVEQGILRAVSVGFAPIEREVLKDNSGILFTKQELLETSLVSIPANPAAVQLAKSLHVSDATMDEVFGKHATADVIHSKAKDISAAQGIPAAIRPGEVILSPQQRQAWPKFHEKTRTMKTISKQIEERQAILVDLQDQLANKVAELDTAEDADVVSLAIDDLNTKIEGTQKLLDQLRKAETSLANAAPAIVQKGETTTSLEAPRRPFAAPKKEVKPFDHLVRSMVITGLSKAQQKHPIDVLKERYGEDVQTKAVMDIVCRAASAPALTTTTGWAAELVQTAFLDMLETLMPNSVYPGLSNRGPKFTFGRNGIISIPARTTSTTVAGSFVAQGAPIPVRQGAFTATTLTPKKMAVITTFSREMAEHSTPAIEAVLRQAIVEDTAVAIDTVLLDATAASSTRPAGLRNGVTGATPTTGGGLAALVGDVKLLATSLISSSNGNLRDPVWIMNPVQVLSIQFQTNANGQFIFADEIANGRFRGYPLYQSTTVPAGTVYLIDAADFFSATGDAPNFNASDTATLHMEDTTPLAIGTTGTPTVVAAPVRSLYQTDSLAIRMTMDLNWAMRRTGVVAFVASVTW